MAGPGLHLARHAGAHGAGGSGLHTAAAAHGGQDRSADLRLAPHAAAGAQPHAQGSAPAGHHAAPPPGRDLPARRLSVARGPAHAGAAARRRPGPVRRGCLASGRGLIPADRG
ncbi:conserved hypothetical protein [Ricinus communis]|uniref:Uncharacterized protein n=1 Tax=Ricinus communis TaxID=3988 RepID=B9TAE3_RICCO|nr:conserved hypothetical protein [Ricinus communis]